MNIYFMKGIQFFHGHDLLRRSAFTRIPISRPFSAGCFIWSSTEATVDVEHSRRLVDDFFSLSRFIWNDTKIQCILARFRYLITCLTCSL